MYGIGKIPIHVWDKICVQDGTAGYLHGLLLWWRSFKKPQACELFLAKPIPQFPLLWFSIIYM